MSTELQYFKIKKHTGSSSYDSWARDMEMYLANLYMWNFAKAEVAATATPEELKIAARARAKPWKMDRRWKLGSVKRRTRCGKNYEPLTRQEE